MIRLLRKHELNNRNLQWNLKDLDGVNSKIKQIILAISIERSYKRR